MSNSDRMTIRDEMRGAESAAEMEVGEKSTRAGRLLPHSRNFPFNLWGVVGNSFPLEFSGYLVFGVFGGWR